VLDKDFHLVLRSAPVRYLVAVGLFFVAVVVRFGVLPPDAAAAYFTFYPAAIFAFYYFGIGPGVLLVLLASAAGLYVNTAGRWGWTLDPTSALDTGAFVVSALLTAWVVQRLVRTSEDLTGAMQQLQSNEERFRAVLEDQDDIVCRFDRTGRVVFANESCRRMTGLGNDQLSSTSWQSVVVPDDLPAVQQRLAAQGPDHPVVVTEHRVAHAERGLRWMEFVNHGFYDASGGLREMQSVGRDVTVRKELEARLESARGELQQLNAEQHAMLDSDLMGIAKLRGREIVWTNRALGQMFGYTRDELLGSTTQKLYEDEAAYLAFGQAAYPVLQGGGTYRTHQRMRRRDGTMLWVDFNGLRLSGTETDSLWLLQDITELKAHQQKIEEMAFHDALTGLPNRALLTDRLGQMLSLCKRLQTLVAVCFIDLDGFKEVNDRLGHEAGDVLLKELARRLQRCVRGNDTIARLGGDEFIVLLSPVQSLDECRTILERIASMLCQPVELGSGPPCSVSASIGVAMFPNDGHTAAALVARADAAMYSVKRAGGRAIAFADGEAHGA
jgi:diguanylate cyclase (GGDEF)-like protein/PAS domain S-box-containing protein